MAQQSVRRARENQECPKRLERATATWTQAANSIQASGVRTAAIKRPDTRKHLDYMRPCHSKILLAFFGASTHGHLLQRISRLLMAHPGQSAHPLPQHVARRCFCCPQLKSQASSLLA